MSSNKKIFNFLVRNTLYKPQEILKQITVDMAQKACDEIKDSYKNREIEVKDIADILFALNSTIWYRAVLKNNISMSKKLSSIYNECFNWCRNNLTKDEFTELQILLDDN